MAYKEDFIQELVAFYKSNLNLLRNFSLSKNDKLISHKNIISHATYSPWFDDKQFLDIYEIAKNNTLVDIYRCYELYSFIIKNSNLRGDVLEVGVWKGGTGSILGKALNLVSPNAQTYLVDTFEGVVKAGEKDTEYKGGEHADTSIETVKSLIEALKIDNVNVLTGIFPNTVNIDSNTKLRLCHIDVDTYDSAKDIFNYVWSMIEVGGCVVFDDYGFWGCEGVTKLCNELSPENASFIYNINGHAIFIKTK